jgi:hypothetical protein
MLSVIDFALAAPVVVREHEVRVSVVDAAKGGTATSPLRRDPSDKWLANAADRTNAPTIPRSSESVHWREQEPRQYNPTPQKDSNVSPEPSNPARPIDPYTSNLLSRSPPAGPGSTSPSPTPTHDTPAPDGSPQIASSQDRSPSFGSWLPADSHSALSPGSSGSSWPSGSSGSSSWPSGSSGSSWPSDSTTEVSHPSSLDRSSPDKNNPSSSDLLSTGESHPPSPGQIDHPLPAPPSEPGPSTRPHYPPGAESSDELKMAAMILVALSKQGFRPRTYSSGAVDAAKGEWPGTIDTKVYVCASPFPLLPTFKRPELRIF